MPNCAQYVVRCKVYREETRNSREYYRRG